MDYRIYCLLLLSIGGFVACTTTHKISSIQVEMMVPGKFTITEVMDTIAIFKRDLNQSDTATFTYHDTNKHLNIIDSLVQYRTLSNQCVDALAKNLVNTGYFLKVINYRDSMNVLLTNKYSALDYNELHKLTGADVCVFLDLFHFKDYLINKNTKNLGREIYSAFPEFRKSTALESIQPNLLWAISIKGVSTPYAINEPEELFYGNNLYPDLFGNEQNHRLLLQTAAEYLGMKFSEKLLPSWQQVGRTYYRSHNVNMLIAEKYLLDGDWMKAAEIYKRQTKNKNQNIAAKAKYNMALICEMEEKYDAANDWLILSYSTYKKENPEHKFNCKQYITLLAERKREIERLKKQVRE